MIITRQSQSLVHYLQPHRVFATLWTHRTVIRQLTARAVAARFRGAVLGLVWSLIIPLVMLIVYTFVFSVVFQARWGASIGSSKVEFAITLFCGLLLFNLFSECVSGATAAVTSNVSYVKKVVFPLEVLPVVTLGTAMVNTLISFALLVVAMSLFMQLPTATIAYFPLVVLPLIMLSLGLAWFVSALNVYLRDTGHVTTVILQVLVFLTPLFYSISMVPEKFQFVMRLNPLTIIVENARQTVLWGHPPNWFWLGVVTLLSWAVMQLGYVWFMKTKRGFADVL